MIDTDTLMKFAALLFCLGFMSTVGLAQKYSCLPPNVKEATVVSSAAASPRPGQPIKKITVGDALKKLNARCSHGKLVDGGRRPITFFYRKGCWGNPPDDYLEIQNRQNAELERLKKKYTVIEMRCDAYGMPM